MKTMPDSRNWISDRRDDQPVDYNMHLFVFAKGKYLAVVPALVDVAGSELNAVIWQTLLSGILGSAFAMISHMGDGALEHCKTDRNLLSSRLLCHDADRLSHSLDGTFSAGLYQVLSHLSSPFCRRMGYSVRSLENESRGNQQEAHLLEVGFFS